MFQKYIIGLKTITRDLNVIQGVKVALIKGVSAFLSLMLVRVSVDFLGVTLYGEWLAFFSVLLWFRSFDFGISSTVRSNMHNWSKNSSSNYVLLIALKKLLKYTLISLVILFVVDFKTGYLSTIFASLFNISSSLYYSLFYGIIMMMISRLIVSIFVGNRRHIMEPILDIFSTAIIILLTVLDCLSILQFFVLNVTLPFIINILVYFSVYRFKYERGAQISFKSSRKFTIIQIAALVLYSTDLLLIRILFTPQEVTSYFIVVRYYAVILLLSGAMTGVLWSNIGAMKGTKDIKSILVDVLPNQYRLLVFLLFLVILMVVSAIPVIAIWVGVNLDIDLGIVIVIGINTALLVFMAPFTMILNGLEVLKLQRLSSMASALINIPASIILARYLGPIGIPLATMLSLLYGAVLRPLQIYKLKRGTTGIWVE